MINIIIIIIIIIITNVYKRTKFEACIVPLSEFDVENMKTLKCELGSLKIIGMAPFDRSHTSSFGVP